MIKTPSPSWKKVTELFEQALDRPSADRSGFLKSACAGDADVQREVESLLAEHEADADFLEAPAVASVANQIFGDEALAAGRRLGQYQIETLLGRGGMGEVYVARDKLGRRVALKLLTERFPGDKSGVARFQQEARTLLSLNHPHIVTVHDIDQIDGAYYIASELVEGETLRQRLDKGELPLAEVVEIVIQVVSALEAAHEKGIVHRDIKPENIMIRRDGFVKVLDFGIAKLTDRNATGESQAPALRQIHTAEGSVVGTAPYMSPEQARGLNVDARTDVWGLGVVLYEALAGCQPFPGETTADIVNSILEKNPAPLNRYSSVVPEALQLIVSRTLLKDREARYQTARELLADLKELRTRIEIALISGEADIAKHLPSRSPAVNTQAMPAPAATTNASTAEFITTEFKRHKFAFTAGVTLLLAGLVLAGFYLKNRIKPAGPGAIQSLAVLPFKNDSGNNDLDYLSEGMTETLINSLSRLPNVLVKSPSAVSRFRAKEIDPKQAGLQLSVDAILIGRVVQRGDDLTLYLSLVNAQTGDQLWGERYLRKLPDLAALQTEIARDVSERVRPLTGNEKQVLTKGGTANSEAYLAYIKGNYYWQNFPRPGYEKSREYFQQAIDLDPTYAMGYTGLAHYYGFAAATGMKPPDENWSRSEDAVNKALALDNTLAETHNARVGIQLYYHRDWREAEQSFRRGVELNPNSSEVHNHYGRCLILFDRTDEAIAEMKRAVALEPLSLRYNQNLATLFFFARQYDQALAQLRKTLELEPNFGPAHEWLGNTYEQKGMQKEAFAEWTAALKIKGESEHASNLEQVYAASGFDAAVRFLGQQQLKQVEEMSNHGDYVAPVEYVLAYTRLGNKEKALEWLDKAVDVRDRQALEFKVNPLFDSLRGDQRFQAALQRIVISK